MTQQLPKPLTPADANLRDFAFMPLDIARLRRSKAWLICKRRPDLAFYMLNLWTACWHDLPAGSLEDDDDVLADLAMCPPKDWPKLRREVMRGWIKCSDGRLYHPVVAEKVVEAWKSKKKHAYDKECGRLRKQATRAGLTDFNPPEFDQWLEAHASGGQMLLSNGQVTLVRGRPKDGASMSTGIPAENALKGEGEGYREGQGEGYISGQDKLGHPTDADPPDMDPHEAFLLVKATYPEFTGRQDWINAEHHCHLRIERDGATWSELIAAVERYAKFVKAKGVSGPQYVMTPGKFFSAVDKPWRQPWDPPPTKAEQRLAGHLNAADEFLRRTAGDPQ